MAVFEKDYYAGMPALTSHSFGKGRAFYLAAHLEEKGLEWLLADLCKQAEVKKLPAEVPANVEIMQRSSEDKSWLFILNHSSEKVNISLLVNGRDLLSGKPVNGTIYLAGNDAAVIELQE